MDLPLPCFREAAWLVPPPGAASLGTAELLGSCTFAVYRWWSSCDGGKTTRPWRCLPAEVK